jgi:hypothetical protein
MAWNPFNSSVIDSLSIAASQMHDGDVTDLADGMGRSLVLRAGCPQYLCNCLVASNISARMSDFDRNLWIDSIARHLPLGVPLSRTEQRSPVTGSIPSEEIELFELLPLTEPTTVSLPTRAGFRLQCPPTVVLIPSETSQGMPHIFSFLPRAQTELLRVCNVVGAVRCHA